MSDRVHFFPSIGIPADFPLDGTPAQVHAALPEAAIDFGPFVLQKAYDWDYSTGDYPTFSGLKTEGYYFGWYGDIGPAHNRGVFASESLMPILDFILRGAKLSATPSPAGAASTNVQRFISDALAVIPTPMTKELDIYKPLTNNIFYQSEEISGFTANVFKLKLNEIYVTETKFYFGELDFSYSWEGDYSYDYFYFDLGALDYGDYQANAARRTAVSFLGATAIMPSSKQTAHTDFSIDVEVIGYLPYKNSAGDPVFDTTTGEQIADIS